jgi:cytochrome P450
VEFLARRAVDEMVATGGECAAHSLGFGFGRHFCLGAHLAKLEIRALFTELLARVDRIELAGEPRLMHSILVSGPKNLPVRFTARR